MSFAVADTANIIIEHVYLVFHALITSLFGKSVGNCTTTPHFRHSIPPENESVTSWVELPQKGQHFKIEVLDFIQYTYPPPHQLAIS